jgi:hypothetical protein
MISKTFLGFVIFLIIVGGVLVFVTADKYDKNNFSLSSEITGIYLAVAGLLWGISLALYNRYADGNVLLSILWFGPLFRSMFSFIAMLIIALVGK